MSASAKPAFESVRTLQNNIEYAIVALGLVPNEIAEILREATGVPVDPTAPDLLKSLDEFQLKATWKRLSADARWQRSGRGW